MALSSILDPRGLAQRLAEAWARVLGEREIETAPDDIASKAAAEAPVIWLVGKVQSGKSSIVHAITGATEAEIGSGFRPCTRTSRVFDFPLEAPVIRFLDTRGLGETGYDPAEDLALAESRSHLLLVVARATDHNQEAVIEAARAVCRRHPDWPIVVAETCLHEAYGPGAGHVLPYPFAATADPAATAAVPERLARNLAHQRTLFSALPGTGPVRFVPIDFTHPDDNLHPRRYGYDALVAAITEVAPHSVGAMLGEIHGHAREKAARRANPLILGHATAAAAADVVPIAGAFGVPGIQARMLHALAAQQNVPWDQRALVEFGGSLGASILTRLAARFGIRQLAKLVPVYGQTVGAAAAAATSFATTYALGKAALAFLDQRRKGEHDPERVAQAYSEALAKAFVLARERSYDGATAGKAASEPTR